jgi:hypothetical protein
VSVDLPDVAKAPAVLGRALPPLHFVGPANDPYSLAIVSGAALLSRWLLLPPTTGASRKIARRRIRHANGPGAFGAPPRPISSMSPQHAAELAA